MSDIREQILRDPDVHKARYRIEDIKHRIDRMTSVSRFANEEICRLFSDLCDANSEYFQAVIKAKV